MKKWYTLVELLIVVLMVWILLAAVFMNAKTNSEGSSIQYQALQELKENIFNPAFFDNVSTNNLDPSYIKKWNEVPQKVSIIFSPWYQVGQYTTVLESLWGLPTLINRTYELGAWTLNKPPYQNSKYCENTICQNIFNEHLQKTYKIRPKLFIVELKDWTKLTYKTEQNWLRIEGSFSEEDFNPYKKLKYYIWDRRKVWQADVELDITWNFNEIEMGFIENDKVLTISGDFELWEYFSPSFKKK